MDSPGLLDFCSWFFWFRFSFLSASQEIGWEERLKNDIFCVEEALTLTQSVNRHTNVAGWCDAAASTHGHSVLTTLAK